jgi:hypothetical protein
LIGARTSSKSKWINGLELNPPMIVHYWIFWLKKDHNRLKKFRHEHFYNFCNFFLKLLELTNSALIAESVINVKMKPSLWFVPHQLWSHCHSVDHTLTISTPKTETDSLDKSYRISIASHVQFWCLSKAQRDSMNDIYCIRSHVSRSTKEPEDSNKDSWLIMSLLVISQEKGPILLW